MKFSVYKHEFTLPSGIIARRQLIVIKHDNGILTFTDFGRYIRGKRAIKTPSSDGGAQFAFVVKMLNYAFQECHITRLTDLTIDIVQEFLQYYASGTLPEDKRPRTKKTVDMCIDAILSFLNNLAEEEHMRFKPKHLYRTEIYKAKYNEVAKRKVPIFEVISDTYENVILRDIPNKAFPLLLDHITNKHPEILGLVLLGAFAGLRPAEACNVRREDSPLGPGIIFNITDGEVTKIQIDLRKEIRLRSDGVSVGAIKKERMATVPVVFIESFMQVYDKYMEYLQTRPCEEAYKPFSVNISGKAMTYPSYYYKFRDIVKYEFAPICLESGDKDIVEFGMILLDHNLSPHALRHWYSVQLTLAGYSAAELMHARGDKNIESALTYLQNKGELEKTYKKVTSEIFDYFTWAAEKMHED